MLIDFDFNMEYGFRYKIGEEEITVYDIVNNRFISRKIVVPIWEYEKLVGVFE